MFIIKDKDGKTIVFNGPPDDKRCMRCGKHIDELIPIGGFSEELLPDTFDSKLIQNFRKLVILEYNERDKMIALDIGLFGVSEELYEFYGREDVERVLGYESVRGQVEVSWECIDCFRQDGEFMHYSEINK
jgi:hypothetical protein